MSEQPVVVFYTRPRCHLCELAKARLLPLLRRHGLGLEERSVADDPAWEQAYGSEVPVAFLEGRKLFKYRIDPGRLERALRARTRGPTGG